MRVSGTYCPPYSPYSVTLTLGHPCCARAPPRQTFESGSDPSRRARARGSGSRRRTRVELRRSRRRRSRGRARRRGGRGRGQRQLGPVALVGPEPGEIAHGGDLLALAQENAVAGAVAVLFGVELDESSPGCGSLADADGDRQHRLGDRKRGLARDAGSRRARIRPGRRRPRPQRRRPPHGSARRP